MKPSRSIEKIRLLKLENQYMELQNQKEFLVHRILVETNLKVGIPLNDTFSTKQLEILV
jgi:hypothetical protein